MADVNPTSPQSTPASKNNNSSASIWPNVLLLVALIAVTVFLLLKISSTKKDQSNKTKAIENRLAKIEAPLKYEQEQVDKTRIQAVFLNNGQVYFGKITNIDQNTLTIEDIYYIKNGSFSKDQVISGSNISLVKLGKEVHSPDDKMIIQRKSTAFWENLKTDGEVAKAIAAYQKNKQ